MGQFFLPLYLRLQNVHRTLQSVFKLLLLCSRSLLAGVVRSSIVEQRHRLVSLKASFSYSAVKRKEINRWQDIRVVKSNSTISNNEGAVFSVFFLEIRVVRFEIVVKKTAINHV